MLPYQVLLFGALGLYLYKLNKSNTLGGQTKVNLDTDKLSKAAMPYVPGITPDKAPYVQQGIKKTLDVIFERIKK